MKRNVQQNIRITKLAWQRNLKDVLFILLGIAFATFGLKGFLLPNHFLDGGAMGISLLLENITGFPLSFLIVLVNLPFIILGISQFSLNFATRSIIAITVLAVLVHFVDFPAFTKDKLLISAFGGFFLGAGIGFTIRGGGVIDGTEVLAIQVSKKTSLTVGDFITVFNALVFGTAALLINLETAMYSMLTYLAASRTVDFIVNGVEEYIGVWIVSVHASQIKTEITEGLGKGVTVFKTEKGYGSTGAFTNNENKALFCVVTRLELTKLLFEIEKIDPQAFIVQDSIRDISGGMVKKRPLH